jgi:6-phosphogluconolactonase (cycloisomerase 2 family)
VAAQSSFLYGSPGRGLNVGVINPANGTVTDSSTGGGIAFVTEPGGFIRFLQPDPRGRFFFTSEQTGSSFGVQLGGSGIGALMINRSTGAVTPAPNGSVILNQPGQKIAVDPAGRHLYTVVSGSISVYLIDQTTGALSLSSSLPSSSRVGGLLIVGPGRFLFNVGNGSATTYTIDPGTGTPTVTNFSASTGATNEQDVAISPNGKYLYIIDASATTKVVLVNSDGSLTPLSPSPTMSGRGISVAVHPNSNFVYIVAFSDSTGLSALEAFQVDSSGALTSIAGSPFSGNAHPLFVAIDASGRFLYVASQEGLITFGIDSGTGAPTQLSTATGSINNSRIITTAP